MILRRIATFFIGIILFSANFKTGAEVYKIGDYYPDPNVKFSAPGVVSNGIKPIGIVFWIDPSSSQDEGKTGTSGMIVSLLEENTDGKGIGWDDGWGVDIHHTEATNIYNGAVNMSTVANYITEKNKSWANFPAFSWVVSIMNEQSTYDGARDRWYLPARNELKMLFAGLSGKIFEKITGWLDGTEMPGFDNKDSIEARDKFNHALVEAGGVILETENEPFYWSSNEDYDIIAWYIDLFNGSTAHDVKLIPCRVRAISTF